MKLLKIISYFLFFAFMFAVGLVLASQIVYGIPLDQKIDYCETKNLNCLECIEIWEINKCPELKTNATCIYVNNSYYNNYNYSYTYNHTEKVDINYSLCNVTTTSYYFNNSFNYTYNNSVIFNHTINCTSSDAQQLLDHEYRMTLADKGLIPEEICNCTPTVEVVPEEYILMEECDQLIVDSINQNRPPEEPDKGFNENILLLGVAALVGGALLLVKFNVIKLGGKPIEDSRIIEVPKRDKSLGSYEREGDSIVQEL
jgi:hypothetical protein